MMKGSMERMMVSVVTLVIGLGLGCWIAIVLSGL